MKQLFKWDQFCWKYGKGSAHALIQFELDGATEIPQHDTWWRKNEIDERQNVF